MRRLIPALSLLAAACTGDPNNPLVEGPAIVSIPDPPPYPSLARAARVQGEVRVRGLVMGSGEPISLAPSAGPAPLGPAAVQFVKGWRFEPSAKAGLRPMEVKVRFVLQEGPAAHPGWIAASVPVITTTTGGNAISVVKN